MFRKFMDLPTEPVLTFTQPEKAMDVPKTIGQHLHQRRLALKLCLAEAAPQMGATLSTFSLWELDRAFPNERYHDRIIAYLGYNPFVE